MYISKHNLFRFVLIQQSLLRGKQQHAESVTRQMGDKALKRWNEYYEKHPALQKIITQFVQDNKHAKRAILEEFANKLWEDIHLHNKFEKGEKQKGG